MKEVRIWEEVVSIPTYPVSAPDTNPLFFENRVYQGSSGKVYPLPITEKIMDQKVEKNYQAVFLENQYLQIMFLPELGGRIQRALDKTNQYDFVYYNHVIKPALVGLTGPWISGGIEFNWPQHHRPSTFMPAEYQLRENEDGSQSLLISEIDKMNRTKGMAVFTLYPGKAYLEIKGQLYNRTDTSQTFLWWANPAVPVNEHTSSIFPPDVHAVMDHGKRAVSTFPIATGEYYKFDYSAGVDISKYKNIQVPTSYMAAHSDYDFIGNYDERIQAGLLHVADHHVSPGKKQWTWGCGDFGKAWDENLSDEDGPYIELMTGVFTDNQPDFTWLRPYEEKSFTQYFMPYKGVGQVKNATIDAVIGLERTEDDYCCVTVYTTGIESGAILQVKTAEDKLILAETLQLTPLSAYKKVFDLKKAAGLLTAELFNKQGERLVIYQEESEKEAEMPQPAEEIPACTELKTTEELFLAAIHLEQYRHATRDPADYYLEGLRRDSSDIRLNTGYGSYLYKLGQFRDSEKYLRKAVKKQMWKSPNPYYGEPLFQLGLSLEMQGKTQAAYDAFYKAAWNEDVQSAAFYKLAALNAQQKKWSQSLEFVEKSLIKNAHHMKARFLEVLLLKELGMKMKAAEKIEAGLIIDPLDLGFNREKAEFFQNSENYLRIMGKEVSNYLELALDYMQFGFYEEAIEVLKDCPVAFPLLGYYQGYCCTKMGALDLALATIKKAERISSNYCFPNKLEEILILQNAIKLLPQAGFARYYLGNLFYDKKQYEQAIRLWEESSRLNPDFPTVFRNLSFACYNRSHDSSKALSLIQKACELDPTDARLLLEQNQLCKLMGISVEQRRKYLEANRTITSSRDDLFIEYLTLLNLQGEHQQVLDLIKSRQFHPWEGGEGKISSQYTYALIELAQLDLQEQPEKAVELLKKAKKFPKNLGEGKLPNNHDNAANYYLGQAYDNIGEAESAQNYYLEAAKGIKKPGSVLYYNDEPADTLFYQGLAYKKSGHQKRAKECFDRLINYGQEHFKKKVTYDFFAVSLPNTSTYNEDLQKNNRLYCQYLIALGKLGLGKYDQAQELFQEILSIDPSYQGAIQHRVQKFV